LNRSPILPRCSLGLGSWPVWEGGQDQVVSGYGRAVTQVDSGRDSTRAGVIGQPGQVVAPKIRLSGASGICQI